MKTLLIASVLAVGIGFGQASQAEINAFGVDLSAEQVEVSANVLGGTVATSAADSIQIQKLQSNESETAERTYDNNSYYVFGVDVEDINQS